MLKSWYRDFRMGASFRERKIELYGEEIIAEVARFRDIASTRRLLI